MNTSTTHYIANPLLNSDWPDLDVTRGPHGYVMVASSSHRVPGLPVLTSPDLVSWRLASRAVQHVLPPSSHVPAHNGGWWAPSIRYHDGLYRIFVPDPDRGIFVTTSPAPEGPWTNPHLVLPGLGLIDPCPFWDDDGRAWLMFAWARSRSGIANRLSLAPMNPTGTRLVGPAGTVIDGARYPGCIVLEGPKLYRRDGWYYVFAPAGGVKEGWQTVLRSRSIHGPYDMRIVLAQGDTEVNGPHQGGWVTTDEGEDWFLHFQDRGPYGRTIHLQPMRWENGWPVIGADGEPMTHLPPPAAARDPVRTHPHTSDEFRSSVLGLQWAWQTNPEPHWLELRGDGVARLAALPTDVGNLWTVPQMLTQPLPGWPCEIRTTVTAPDLPVGGRTGVAVLAPQYSWVGVEQRDDGMWAVVRSRPADALDEDLLLESRLGSSRSINVIVTSDGAGKVTLGLMHGNRVSLAAPVAAAPSSWTSAELALFAAAPVGIASSGHVHFGPVVFDPADGA
ncbi:glycoside hydrolase 43 family protein [Georgenia halophila]|uniref:Glycoside hydrolase 43 family protein n=1 Tax=Georgenia halophila TaxID=620889 RepID=A0ABP8LHZ8_9MICO